MDKKSVLALMCCVIMMFTVITSISYGDTGEVEDIKYVKIGLNYPITSDKEINLYSDNGFSIKVLSDEFNEIMNFEGISLTARLDYNFQEPERKSGAYHIELAGSYNSYTEVAERLGQIKTEHYEVFPVYENGTYKIWIGQYPDESEALMDMYRLSVDVNWQMTVIKDNKKRIILEDSNDKIILLFDCDSNIFIGTSNKDVENCVIGVGDRSYRGFITFNRLEDKLFVINYINLEKYLYGVVPREMSGSWPMEALKAQAVAARNYALKHLSRHWNEGYDLCDSTHCQVYAGYNWENIRSNNAVDETLGKVLKYNGDLVNTFYHSSSGGKTEDSENVWTYPIPYLRGVDDEFSLGAPNDNWKLVLTKEEIAEKLRASEIYIGEIISIKPIEHSDNGRVIKLSIEGTEGTHILEKDGTRKVLGYNSLKSTMFNTESDGDVYVLSAKSSTPQKVTLGEATLITADGIQVVDRNTNESGNTQLTVYNGKNERSIPAIPNLYVFNGSGWGHGLGMSQWGAKKMAELGYDYVEILKHYYTDTNVE